MDLWAGICNWECENTVFYLGLVESINAKPTDTRPIIFTEKNLHISRPTHFKLILFMGQLCLILK